MTDTPPVDEMRYDLLAQEALRGVIRAALERAAGPDGLPGEHRLFITFLTQVRDVEAPADILAKYPHDMTIVLQHQYWDLDVRPDGFSVTLKFGGAPKVLNVPFSAILRFEDPAARFMLQFDPSTTEDALEFDDTPEPEVTPPAATAESVADDDSPKVVSLDQFRKK